MCHLRVLTYTLLAAVLGPLLLDGSPCLPLFLFDALPWPSGILASTRTDFLQLCKCVLSFEAIWNIEVLKEALLVYLLKCLLVCYFWPELNIMYLSLTFHAAQYRSVTIGCILFFSENSVKWGMPFARLLLRPVASHTVLGSPAIVEKFRGLEDILRRSPILLLTPQHQVGSILSE